MERILDLGGKLEHNEAQAFPVCESFEEYLNHELKQQAELIKLIGLQNYPAKQL